MDIFGVFVSPWVMLLVVAGYHLAVLWLLWRIARALERKAL